MHFYFFHSYFSFCGKSLYVVFAKCQMLETKEGYSNCAAYANLSILRESYTNMSLLGKEILSFGLFSFGLYIVPESTCLQALEQYTDSRSTKQKAKIHNLLTSLFSVTALASFA